MLSILLIGVGLSMDAFAVSVTSGLTVKGFGPKHAALLGIYFGGFQFLMPLIGYLLGSISTGVIVSRVFGHKDIRSEGSGNSGTTNMLRVMGKKYALLTFAGDLLKGIVAVLIGKAWLGTQAGEIVGAFGAILGHNFPLYFGFKGGKGIATSFGCLLIVFPMQTLCAFGVFLLIVALTRYVSAGSLGAAVTLPFFIMFTTPCNPVIWGSVIAICLLAIWRHAPNIKRLMNHTESKISLSKKK